MRNVAGLVAGAAVAAVIGIGEVRADVQLPAPWVSRALDAVLMPVNGAVRQTFDIAPDAKGLLVLSVDPAGTGAFLGLQPGDVIDAIGDKGAAGRKAKKVRRPVDLDAIVYWWISAGIFDFGFDCWCGGSYGSYDIVITEEEFHQEISFVSVETWTSVEYESFSYSAYWEEYSEVAYAEWESSETMIAEETSSEDFAMSMESDAELYADPDADEPFAEGMDDGADMDAAETDEAAADEGMADEAMEDEAATDEGMADEGMEDEGMADAAAGDEGMADESAVDCSDPELASAECGGDDMAAEDEAVDDGGAMDDGGDEGGDDEGGDDGGGDEPVIDE